MNLFPYAEQLTAALQQQQQNTTIQQQLNEQQRTTTELNRRRFYRPPASAPIDIRTTNATFQMLNNHISSRIVSDGSSASTDSGHDDSLNGSYASTNEIRWSNIENALYYLGGARKPTVERSSAHSTSGQLNYLNKANTRIYKSVDGYTRNQQQHGANAFNSGAYWNKPSNRNNRTNWSTNLVGSNCKLMIGSRDSKPCAKMVDLRRIVKQASKKTLSQLVDATKGVVLEAKTTTSNAIDPNDEQADFAREIMNAIVGRLNGQPDSNQRSFDRRPQQYVRSILRQLYYSSGDNLLQYEGDGVYKVVNSKRFKSSTMECSFCKNNNEDAAIYKTHTIRDHSGEKTTCPLLR